MLSSNAHEYYLGDLPGTLQYNKQPTEIINTINLNIIDNDNGYIQVLPTNENRLRLIPDTSKGNSTEWKILTVFQRNISNGQIWLKGALLNTATNKIALMTSTNNIDNIRNASNRALNSKDSKWFVGHYRMCAPMNFWRSVASEATKLN
jgi:hypothetical protein